MTVVKKLWMLLALLLALGMTGAWAEEADEPIVYTSGEWEYVLLEDGTAEIADYHGETEELTIPAEIDGYAVTAIGDNAISYTSSLTSVTIPDSVTTIGDRAFYSCYYLTSVTIPDSVTVIGANPFGNCGELADIIVSPDHPTLATINGVLFDKTEKKLICYPCAYADSSYVIPQGIRAIGDHAFDGGSSLTSVTIPDSVTSIGNSAFYCCYSLTSVTIPDSVTSIGDYTFCWCDALTSINIPDSVTAIGDSAFSYCESLTSITIPDSVTAIGANPFRDCSNLIDIIVSPDHPTLATIDGVLFDKAEKKLICYPCAIRPRKVKQRDEETGKLRITEINTSYDIPQGIQLIGDYAFYSCKWLESITIPDSVTSIGDNSFIGCDALTSITIPDSVTSIGESTFQKCESLTSVTLPASLTSIANNAFADCGGITFTVPRDSYARQWCKDNGYTYTYPDALDWLND